MGGVSEPLSEHLERLVASVAGQYHRLVIVVGPHRSGKTKALTTVAARHGWPLVNLGLELSERLLPLTARQRPLRAAGLVGDIVRDRAEADVVLLDDIELLFEPSLQQDPLRLLQGLARNVTIVASWRGSADASVLTYGVPGHPEYRRYEHADAILVSAQA